MITVFCNFRVVGFHSWPTAPADHDYLRYPHRHEFHITVETEVSHSERCIEFIQMKQHAKTAFCKLAGAGSKFGSLDFEGQSCETLATRLKTKMVELDPKYHQIIMIKVSEDGENGARVTFSAL